MRLHLSKCHIVDSFYSSNNNQMFDLLFSKIVGSLYFGKIRGVGGP